MKENIKEAILGKLVDEEALIRRGVAQCVSAIAQIEIPMGQWPQLISVLTENSGNNDSQIKKSALQTLSFIVQELDEIDYVK